MAPALILSLLVLAQDPPIQLTLSSNGEFRLGEKPRVHIELAEDGHVVVLHADRDGRVRVLFPLEPDGDDFVRAGDEVEIKGRNGRQPFFLDYEGGGTVVAARADAPFDFTPFVRGDHWDYRALGANRDAPRADAEAALLDIVRRMAGGDGFAYDVVPYTVDARFRRPYGYGRSDGYARLSIGFGFGYPYRYGFNRPFCYDPFWGYDSFCGSGYFYSPFYYSPFYYPSFRRPIYFGGDGFARPRAVVPRERDRVIRVEPRRRVPTAVQPRGRAPDRVSGRGEGRTGRGTSRAAPPRSRRP